MRSFIICTSHQIYSSYQIKKNEKGEACSTYGGEVCSVQRLGGETGGKVTTWKNQT